MAVSSDGALWVTEESISAIARIDARGHVRQYRIPGSSNDPSGILQGPDGRMWFVGFEVLGQVDLSGRMTGWQTGDGTNILPDAIALGPGDDVWATGDTGPMPTISRVIDSQGPVTVAILPDRNYVFPAESIAAGPDNAVWFSEVSGDSGKDAIGRVTADGRYTAWPLPPATIPQRIAAGPDHAMWFTERTGIGRITPAGTITSFPVQPGSRPDDITRGPDGALWFTTRTHVGRITTAGRITTWPIRGAKSLSSIVVAPQGGFWVADKTTSIIWHFRAPLLRSQPVSPRQGTRTRILPPCSAPQMFAAVEAKEHFNSQSPGYNDTIKPGASDPICHGAWAIASISRPNVGATDGFTLFTVRYGHWVEVAGVGGVTADCVLQAAGVPPSAARALWPPVASLATYCDP